VCERKREVAGEWRKIDSEEFYNLIFTKYLGQLNQSMRWFDYVARVWT
jgi:hypothetical protein